MDFVEEMRQNPDFEEGGTEAGRDIAAGILKQRAFGKLVPWWEDVALQLREQFGIGFEIVAMCMTTTGEAARALGYNERMVEEIIERFGSDVVAAKWRQASTCRHLRIAAWAASSAAQGPGIGSRHSSVGWSPCFGNGRSRAIHSLTGSRERET